MDVFKCPVACINQVKPNDFVRFWDGLYSDSDYDEVFYRKNIGQPLNEKLIFEWFEWKNGGPLSEAKSRSVHRNFILDERIGHDADATTLAEYLNRPGGAIWRIFWVHLQHPGRFPIYDQHVHRAMAFIQKWPEREIPDNSRAKVRHYLDDYRPFFDHFRDCKHRQVDRALWSFGKLLKTDYGRIFTSLSIDKWP